MIVSLSLLFAIVVILMDFAAKALPLDRCIGPSGDNRVYRIYIGAIAWRTVLYVCFCVARMAS